MKRKILETIIRNGYCVGCGACASLENSPFVITLNKWGQYEACLDENLSTSYNQVIDDVSYVCPFSEVSANENEIAEKLGFSGVYEDGVGYFISIFCGFVREGSFRRKGSSGGFGTWIAQQLLSQGYVDSVIHVRPANNSEDILFKYSLSNSEEEILQGCKSRYYPVEFSAAIAKVREKPCRYAFIGIPCFVKAVRLLSHVDPLIEESIQYTVSLFCGHLKSKFFAEMMAWEVGIYPDNLKKIDFRKKMHLFRANNYGVEIKGKRNNKTITRCNLAKSFIGGDWGVGAFKYKACDFCDDIVGETADISIGDAWTKKYTKDSNGTNFVVIRNKVIQSIVEKAIQENRVTLKPVSAQLVIQSQKAGYNHKRDRLRYRLQREKDKGNWVPTKRFLPDKNILNSKERTIQDIRSNLARRSLEIFQQAKRKKSIDYFYREFTDHLRQYYSHRKSRYFFFAWLVFRKVLFHLDFIFKLLAKKDE